MGKTGLAVTAAMLALAVPAAAAPSEQGMGAPDFRDRFVDAYELEDFCGTGETVDVVERAVVSAWESDSDFRLVFASTATYAYGDATAQDRWAGRVWDELESGVQEGAHTHVVTHTGLRAVLKAPRGGRVTRDAGNLEIRIHFGPDHEFQDVEILHNRGPHPDFTDDAWCGAAIEILGLPA